MTLDPLLQKLFLILIVVLLEISSSSALNTSSGEIPLQPEGDGNDSCTVPAYSQPLFEVNATEENTRRLLIEGRCYLSCFNRYLTSIMNVTLYPIWPFPILNEDVTCTSNIAQIHECTRGCRILLLDQNVTQQNFNEGTGNTIIVRCLNICLNDCRTECGGREYCDNPDTIDLWVAKTGCPNSCNRRLACQLGCLNGEDIVIKDTPYPPSLPLDPVAPPTLTELMNSTISNEQGLYLVNLTKAAGDRDGGGGQYFWNGFLFRILDLASSNITYIWQHDPRKYLNLSSHSCQRAEVSFAVVNQFGPTNFSAPVRLTLRRGSISVISSILMPSTLLSSCCDVIQTTSEGVTRSDIISESTTMSILPTESTSMYMNTQNFSSISSTNSITMQTTTMNLSIPVILGMVIVLVISCITVFIGFSSLICFMKYRKGIQSKKFTVNSKKEQTNEEHELPPRMNTTDGLSVNAQKAGTEIELLQNEEYASIKQQKL